MNDNVITAVLAAMNAAHRLHEEATDQCLDDTEHDDPDHGFDGHPCDAVRDMAYTFQEDLFAVVNDEIAGQRKAIVFDRSDGTYKLETKA